MKENLKLLNSSVCVWDFFLQIVPNSNITEITQPYSKSHIWWFDVSFASITQGMFSYITHFNTNV